MRLTSEEALLERLITSLAPLLPSIRRASGRVEVRNKRAKSKFGKTVTAVDEFIQDYLTAFLLQTESEVGVIAEESTWLCGPKVQKRKNVLIDPIDGTSWFAKGSDDYSILIGVLEKGIVECAAGIYPASGYSYIARTSGCYRRKPLSQPSSEIPVHIEKCNKRVIAAHYRLKERPFLKFAQGLERNGWKIATNGNGFGTNLSGARMVLSGKARAFIGPYMSIHDGFVPAKLIQSAGGVVQFYKPGKVKWKRTGDWFFEEKKEADGISRRCRFIAADDIQTISQILYALN